MLRSCFCRGKKANHIKNVALWSFLLPFLLFWQAAATAATVWNVGGSSPDYAGIQQAIDSSSVQSGDTISVHSGTYNPVALTNGKALVIQEATGETAVVSDTSGTQPALLVTGTGINSTWNGIDITRSGNGASARMVWIKNGVTHSEIFKLQNCTVRIDSTTAVNAKLMEASESVEGEAAVFSRNIDGGGSNNTILLGDKGCESTFTLCTFGPSTGRGLATSDASATVRRLILRNCTFTSLPIGYWGLWNGCKLDLLAEDCQFGVDGGHIMSVYAGSASSIEGSSFDFRRCKFLPSLSGRNALGADSGDGADFAFANCLFVSDNIGHDHIMQINQHAHHWKFLHCTMTETAGQYARQLLYLGHAVNGGAGNAANGTYEFQNCIINWPQSTVVAVLSVQVAPQVQYPTRRLRPEQSSPIGLHISVLTAIH